MYRYLSAHELVRPPLIKEIQYFTLNYDQGLGWYRAHFPWKDQRSLTFDASPYYLFHPLAAQRAADLLPDARLIVLLRDPVQRAFSHYRHNVHLGTEEESFAEAVRLEADRLSGEEKRLDADPGYVSTAHRRYSYLARGEYARQLRRWLDVFPRDRLLVLFSEEMFADPEVAFRKMLVHLGLPVESLSEYPVYTKSPKRGAGDYIGDELQARLHKHFGLHNRELEALLDCKVPWGY